MIYTVLQFAILLRFGRHTYAWVRHLTPLSYTDIFKCAIFVNHYCFQISIFCFWTKIKKSKRKFLHQFSTIKRKNAIQDLPLINLSLNKKYRKLKEKETSDLDELGFEPTSLFWECSMQYYRWDLRYCCNMIPSRFRHTAHEIGNLHHWATPTCSRMCFFFMI